MSGQRAPLLELPPVTLYIHLPWCIRKCPYCDFNSHASKGEIPQTEYINALLQDFEADASLLQGRPLQSIFFGGGTPSLFDPEQLGRLLEGISALAKVSPEAEVTLEANPGTAEQARFQGFREIGFNRLSLGIQSFDDASLKNLGRIHDGRQARAAFFTARKAGFENINLDLMHGLPEQRPEQAMSDLQQALTLEPEHLSWYQLTIEPNTEFFSTPPVLPDEAHLEAIETSGLEMLKQVGFSRYEVSAYAKDGRQSCHNLNYWRFGDYIGIGAGAHGKLTCPDSGEIIRTTKTRQPADYLQAVFPQTQLRKSVAHRDRSFEFMMNWLRLGEPVDFSLYSARTGNPPDALREPIQAAVEQQLLEAGSLRPTELGMRFLNHLVSLFQP